MPKKTISMTLSERSIADAIRQLEEYRDSLIKKNDEFVRKLAEAGIPVINERIAAAAGDSDKNHNTYIRLNSFDDYSEGVLVCEGRGLLWIEFGAGVHYNGAAGTSPHPKGQEFGYTIGSYGKGQGAKDFWYYYADTGEAVRSYGTEATMPVYSASVKMRDEVLNIAKEVFGA